MAHFTPALFAFLRDLESNNERDWFNANKDRYLEQVQEPALEFIVDFGKQLAGISPHFTADARVQGGSLFRIYRDTRFSKDKTPYKTNTGVHFRHEAAKDVHAPGYYIHLEPGACFAGVGLWRPESKVAYAIREKIDGDPSGWKRATRTKRFSDVWSLTGDSLTRPPKGYDADHPLIEDLKRKDFIASRKLTQGQVTANGFVEEFAGMCKTATPFMRFLCEAVGVPF